LKTLARGNIEAVFHEGNLAGKRMIRKVMLPDQSPTRWFVRAAPTICSSERDAVSPADDDDRP